MKKFQKLLQDNLSELVQIEDSLFHYYRNDDDFKISQNQLHTLYHASGALAMIDENFDFKNLSLNVAHSFAELIVVYASTMDVFYMSVDARTAYFDLARSVKDNVQYYRLRQPLWGA